MAYRLNTCLCCNKEYYINKGTVCKDCKEIVSGYKGLELKLQEKYRSFSTETITKLTNLERKDDMAQIELHFISIDGFIKVPWRILNYPDTIKSYVNSVINYITVHCDSIPKQDSYYEKYNKMGCYIQEDILLRDIPGYRYESSNFKEIEICEKVDNYIISKDILSKKYIMTSEMMSVFSGFLKGLSGCFEASYNQGVYDGMKKGSNIIHSLKSGDLSLVDYDEEFKNQHDKF